jgi:hypothetical protein
MRTEGIIVAKRLECAGFGGAVERAKNLERLVILVRTESGAEVTADASRISRRRELLRVFRVFRG